MGRKLRNQFAATVATTDSPLLSPNVRRRLLILSAPVTNRYTVSFNGQAVLDSGITIYPGTVPLVLSEDDIG